MSHIPIANPSVVLREESHDYPMPYGPDRVEVFCPDPAGVFPRKRSDGRRRVEDIPGERRSCCGNVPAEAGKHLREYIGDPAKRGPGSADESQGA